MAKTYQVKPSDILHVTDPIAAWCFDRAIFLFGSTMQHDLDNAGRGAKNPAIANGKRQQVMSKWLGTPVQYRSPGVVKKNDEDKAVDVDSSASGPVKL